jgi:2-keto-4-pentenoate hydratase/2-oxohepta-3-ene-1,7-dioic acid hydratase in catechol pathway
MSTQIAPATTPGSTAVTAYRLATARLGREKKVVVLVDGVAYLLTDLVHEPVPDAVDELLVAWSHWAPVIEAGVSDLPGSAVSGVQPDSWLAPVQPEKLICIGANYHDHLREMGTPPPALPYSFLKPVSTGIVPTGTDVTLPSVSSMVDWEAELAIVIGTTPTAERPILDSIAGFVVLNDLSARDWIIDKPAVGIDWVMQKGYDGFSPIGPYFTPREFVADPQNLWIKCWVNGELKQDSNTSEMVFGVEQILTHLAAIMTLLPGDVIATGTPAGVGFGARPQQFLTHGDMVAVEIEGLGRLETRMVDPSEGGHR